MECGKGLCVRSIWRRLIITTKQPGGEYHANHEDVLYMKIEVEKNSKLLEFIDIF